MKLLKNYSKVIRGFRCWRDALNAEIKAALTEILQQVPGNTLDLTDSPGYAYILAPTDQFVETCIYGVRLHKSDDGSSFIECCTETMMPDDDIDDWSEQDCIRDGDHYSDINWISILEAANYAAKKLK